jgi:flagellar hook-associated protein 1 FlgK
MTQANGLLSGLEINGKAMDTGVNGDIRGGTLAAQFEVRDVISVEAQEDLDAMAKDLIERFQDPALDTTLAAGDPGLFTDNGAAFDPVNTLGIANRIELNTKVAMDGDAESWRLRDGLNAAAPGEVGNAALLDGYSTALEASKAISSVGLGTGIMSATTISGNLISRFAQHSALSDQALTYATNSFNEMSQMEKAQQGVDSDAELQNLMLIEQAYTANAKVMTVLDELMDTLLRM